MSWQSCPPSLPLLALFFLMVESLQYVLAISFLFLKWSCIPYLARFARGSIKNQITCTDQFSKLVGIVCRSRVIIGTVFLPGRFARTVSTSRPSRFLVCKWIPLMRAPDKWESARFSSRFPASSFFRSRALSPLRPLAGNACRWAACFLFLR